MTRYTRVLLALANKRKLLSPLASTPIFMCIGLNYAHHAKEANVSSVPIS
jgi:2-keto-4-pentenoate hydratase/2-oxohepta-3-ene-1,7-dioic acid hydratase in catechol pathway